MKQLQFTFKDEETLNTRLAELCEWYRSDLYSGMLIQIYTEILDRQKIERICNKIDDLLPEALYMGCSSNGNIVQGEFSGGSFAMICTAFKCPSTRVELLQYPLGPDNQKEVASRLAAEVDKRDWVRGVEFLTTIRNMSMTTLCEELSVIRPDVQIFGGGAFAEDISANEACVFSKDKGYMEKGIVFALFGGKDLHIDSSFITGWKPLGSFLNVTDADGCILRELNGTPAYETYYRYLHIKNDENFFYHTLEFPFIYRQNGIDIMRAPVAGNPDGSLTMTSDIAPNVKARLAYGDPWTILESTRQAANRLLDFDPESITVFSCAGRRTFWGNEEVGKETEAYQMAAPTSGFYTSSEFLRTGTQVNQHNVTQVLVAMREGPAQADPDRRSRLAGEEAFGGKVSVISRLASFIKATMEELEEANKLLSTMAITDGLTGLLNRSEIQRRIEYAIDEAVDHGTAIYLIMLDLDDFKHVNDLYGHKEGDNVLIRISGLLKEAMVDLGSNGVAGRWGGEEFMLLLTSVDKDTALIHAERIRGIMEEIHFEKAGTVTVSIGVIRVGEEEKPDRACVRADEALYQAKRTGKNRVVYLEE